MTRPRFILAAVLAAAATSPVPASEITHILRPGAPRVRTGGGFQDDYVLGTMKDTTVHFMLENRQVTRRVVGPFERVRESLDVLRTHKHWKTRRAAIDDLMFHPSSGVEEALIRALRDPVLSVRQRAIQALGEIGTNRALTPLMNAMDFSPGPIRDEIALTLRRLTGEDYGRHHDRWQRWYQANRDVLR